MYFINMVTINMVTINMVTIATFYYPVPIVVTHERNLGYQNTAQETWH